jgi:hypothetical protein
MNRPIKSLEEDFDFLGVSNLNEGSSSQQYDDEHDEFDGDDLDEGRVKLRRVRGMERMKSRRAGKRYYKAHKAKIRRKGRSTKSRLMRKKRQKMGGKARKGYRRTFAWSRKKSAKKEGLDYIGNMVESLNHDTNVGSFGNDFQDLALAAREMSESYGGLAEEFVSTVVDFGVVSDAASEIAAEAMEYAEAISEHAFDLSAQDRALLSEHMDSLGDELEDLFEMYIDTISAIELTEGEDLDDIELAEDLDDDDLEMVDLEELAEDGIEVIDYEDYMEMVESEESAYTGGRSHANGQVHGIGNVMNPLGINRAGHREKLVLAGQLRRETSEDLDYDSDYDE